MLTNLERLAHLDRALPSGGEGGRFESCISRKNKAAVNNLNSRFFFIYFTVEELEDEVDLPVSVLSKS